MKRKVLKSLLPVVLGAMCLTGCGASGGDTAAEESQAPAADGEASAEQTDSAATDEAAAGEAYLVGFANNSDTYNYCAKFRSYLKEET